MTTKALANRHAAAMMGDLALVATAEDLASVFVVDSFPCAASPKTISMPPCFDLLFADGGAVASNGSLWSTSSRVDLVGGTVVGAGVVVAGIVVAAETQASKRSSECWVQLCKRLSQRLHKLVYYHVELCFRTKESVSHIQLHTELVYGSRQFYFSHACCRVMCEYRQFTIPTICFGPVQKDYNMYKNFHLIRNNNISCSSLNFLWQQGLPIWDGGRVFEGIPQTHAFIACQETSQPMQQLFTIGSH